MIAPERQYITLDDENLLKLAIEDGPGFIRSLPPFVIIDEIQRAPNLMLAIKKSVDEDRRPGRFLLTGSANLQLMEQIQESLAGRHEPIYLYPLTSHELSSQPVENSFANALIHNRLQGQISAYQDSLQKLKTAVCRGGYPIPLSRSESRAKKWFEIYINDVIDRDLHNVGNIKNTSALLHLFELCAMRTASLLEVNTLAKECRLSAETVKNYLHILQKLFLIRQLPSWSTNLGKRLIKSPKVHVTDTGIVASICNLSADDWLFKPDLFGHLIESYTVQQIITQCSWLDDDVNVYHYRDQKKREVDLVIEKPRALWGIEMKRASTLTDKDYSGLKELSNLAGKTWMGGAIFYTGDHIMPTPVKNTFAIPYGALWDGYK
jgi:predicted AAA+ superfamily ATPase